MNPGLIAIIGNKGAGKSALADILALAANTHCPDLEVLTAKRFRQGNNISKHFQATLTWTDGKPVDILFDQDPDTHQRERVRYVPQQFIENLCEEWVLPEMRHEHLRAVDKSARHNASQRTSPVVA